MGFLLLLPLIFFLIAASDAGIVTRLPGYTGDLPFTFETGYVGVGERDDVQLFYYFVESQRNPLQDPLLLWIPGGPGCSALGGFFFESGTLSFDVGEYNGNLPSLHLNPYAWTKGLNIIYLDVPVGTGFSYSKSSQGYYVGDYKFVSHTYEFLKKWLMKHPKFLENSLYIAGEGYSGNPLPMIVQEILNGNEVGRKPIFNIKGYMIGNPGTDKYLDFNARIPFAHRLTLISDELYESAKTNCNGDFISVNPSKQCASDIDAINELISQIDFVQILEPSCNKILSQQTDVNWTREYLKEKTRRLHNSQSNGLEPWCRTYNHMLSYIWANDEEVQKALHVRKGTKTDWPYCNDTLNHIFTHDISSVVDYHRNLTKTSLRVLIYSGDHDMAIPHIGTQQWISSLNLTLDESWRSWSVDDQNAGYTRKFIGDGFSLTFATVKGAGHFAAEYKVKECSAMIDRWFAYTPL